MAEGGTLPFKITQSVTLYNTTGVIEKEKNIYFSPLLKGGTTTSIRERWLTKFNVECPPSAEYTDINISKWSPQDRTLKLSGNVDDFRVVTEHGKALNYLILKRNIYSAENVIEQIIYYAFFITDVKQAGQGSIQLTLEPDHFTNIFWLHNTYVHNIPVNDYYDPYNKKMKNCYVERQHYNRVKLVSGGVDTLSIECDPREPRVRVYVAQVGVDLYEVTIETGYAIDVQSIRDVVLSRLDFDQTDVSSTSRVMGWHESSVGGLEVVIEVNSQSDYIESRYFDYALFEVEYNKKVPEEDNLPIFSQIEESFKYKRQYRDYKEWLNYGDPITAEEKKVYEEAETWSDLTSEQKIKALKLSTAFIHITLNTSNVALNYGDYYDVGAQSKRNVDISSSKIPNVKGVEEKLRTLSLPIYNKVDYLAKFKSEISDIFSRIYFDYYEKTRELVDIHYVERIAHGFIYESEGSVGVNPQKYSVDPYLAIENFLRETSPLSTYVISATISKESSLKDFINYTEDSIYFNIYIPYEVRNPARLSESNPPTWRLFSEEEVEELKLLEVSGIYDYVSRLKTRGTSVTNELVLTETGEGKAYFDIRIVPASTYISEEHSLIYFAYRDGGQNVIETLSSITKLLLQEKLNKISFNLDLSNKNIPNIKNNYYDTVLSFNPYSFYSLSYLGRVENILNKLNYYEYPKIKFDMIIHFSDVFKISITPIYKIGELEQYFYSEGIDQVLTCQLTILSSAYSNYIVQNHAQMKNQFAVNDLRNKTEMINTAIHGVGNTANSTIKGGAIGGWQGALTGLATGIIKTSTDLIANKISWNADYQAIDMNQKAKLSDLGTTPSNLKQVGSDLVNDLVINEIGMYLNHYRIDEVSYNSICKYLERFGYVVNIYDTLNVNTRIGWDFVKLVSFDYEAVINIEQEESIRQIFAEGVTLLHDKSYMSSGHNYELILKEVVLSE